jgi:NAD(P)-dependent dehydrogenase (short-subunit alcohol dehydrogenase family)
VGDVSVPEDARRMVGAAVERFGRIDILVANAGVIPLSTIVDATPEDWDHVMNVDGRGMFLTCKYAIEEMLKTGAVSSCASPLSPASPDRHSRQLTDRPSSSPPG